MKLSETPFTDRDRNNWNSVAITNFIVFINLFPRPGHDLDVFKWRVRTVDDQQQMSDWVEGRQFVICLVAQRPLTVANLVNVIAKLNQAAFIAGGPIDIPRVFFVPQFPPGEKETDFSGLNKWI
jgi:hypothetical protein